MKHRIAPVLFLLTVTVCSTLAQQKTGLVMWGSEPECKSATATAMAIDKPRCDFLVSDGLGYRVLFHAQKTIAITFATDGDYLLADVFVSNDGKERFLIEPAKWAVFGYKDEAASLNNQKPLFQTYAESPKKISDKIERNARWSAVFANLGAALATSTSQINGQVQNSNGGSATYSGTVTSPDTNAQRQAAINSARNQAAASSKADSVMEIALRANTMFPDMRVAGRVYFKKGKAAFYEVYLPIGDTLYLFTVKRGK